MIAIESPQNPRVQAAARLRERRERVATGLTLVDGARECRRALEASVAVEAAFVHAELATSADARAALELIADRGIDRLDVSARAFEKVAFGDRADGIILVVRTPSTELASLTLGPDPLLLVTEDVEKPGNVGAILRTADAAGCAAVIAVGGTDLFNPNVIRASAGIAFSMPMASASAADVIAWLRDRSIRVVATLVDAATPYTAADLRGPIAIVLGSEANGLGAVWRAAGVEGVSIPMAGVADSLNVSATAAILAFEARRQRGTA